MLGFASGDRMSTLPAPTVCGFSVEHYREIASLLVVRGYRCGFFSDGPNEDPAIRTVIVRHDVDQSLEAAERLGQLENSLGVRATYFVWLTSPFYNCFDPAQRALIGRLMAAGHEIGLHFDASRLADGCSVDQLEADVVEECAVLERVVDRPVRTMSFHRPKPELIRRDLRIPGYTSAYGRRFSEDFKYLSDSGRNWREGCVCQKLRDDDAPTRLHLLTHAFWWTGKGDSIASRANEFIREKASYIDVALGQNVKGYTPQS
jgi:hypothetical protein